MKRRLGDNPFYALLIACGILFTLTAVSYFVMTLRAEQAPQDAGSAGGLMGFLREHGALLLLVELAVLAVFCTAAMLSDNFWAHRASARREQAATSGAPDTIRPKSDSLTTP